MRMAVSKRTRFQSTLPRGERHFRSGKFANYMSISIHAPARGATIYGRRKTQRRKISIHAPARGATFRVYQAYIGLKNFNPRSREGSDNKEDPAVFGHRNFNPRSREGSDKADGYATSSSYVFQSTLPRGERQIFWKP